MKYSIIVPTFNHCDDLLRPCVESIFQYTDMTEVELIISANGCTDNTLEYLEQLRERFNSVGMISHYRYLWNASPLGYAQANNVAIDIAQGDYIVLLNNDTVLLPQNKSVWLHQMHYQFWVDPKCGISAPSIIKSEPAGCEFAVFFCVMISKHVFKTIGFLNTDYGVGGGEDTEFCIEAQKAGYTMRQSAELVWDGKTNQYTGGMPIYHKGEGTVHDPQLVKDWQGTFDKNSLLLAKKYNPQHYRYLLSNNYERAVYLKGDTVDPRERTRYEWAAEQLYYQEIGNEPKILEIGCSTGYGVQFLPKSYYIGMDYDPNIVKVAQDQHWGTNTWFVHHDMNTFDYAYYDCIVAFEVIEHVDNGMEVVQMLKKYCDLLLISVPYKEPKGFWGEHHKLHGLSEIDFPGFSFQYIDENGNLLHEPNPNTFNLMLAKWENPYGPE